MKKVSLLILIQLIRAFGFSQSSLPKNVSDSLWSVWSDTLQADSCRVLAIDELAWYGYLYSQPDSGFYYAQLEYEFAQSKNLKNYMAAANNAQGISFYLRGDYSEAIYYYGKSLKIQEEIGNQQGIAASLNNMGIVFIFQGDYDKAFDYYSRSLKIAEEIGNLQSIANTLNNIGIIYVYKGDNAKSIEYYQRSLIMEESLGNQQGIANSLNCLGMIYFAQGDFGKALDFYIQSLKIQERLSDKQAYASVLNNIGLIFDERRDYPRAIEYYNQSLNLQQLLGDKYGAATSLFNIGKIYFVSEDYENAKEQYYQSLKIRELIGDKLGIALTLTGVAMIYNKLNDPQMAIPLAHRALDLAQEINALGQIKNASRALLESYIQTGQPDSSLFYISLLKNTIEQELSLNYFTLSEREKELYFATLEEDFGRYYDFTLFHHTTFSSLADTAYNLALTNKGLSLKSSSAMRLSILNSSDSVLISNYNEWIQLKRKISDLYFKGNDTKLLENEADALEKALVKKSDVFSEFDKIKNLDWKKIKYSLLADECAIEFVNFKSEIDSLSPVIYMALLVKPESMHPEIIRLCNETELEEILGTFQGNNLGFVNTVYGTRGEAKTALYEKIWQPLENYLEGVKTIYYSPSGLLHKISFVSISIPKTIGTKNVFLSDIYNFRQMSSTGKVALHEEIVLGHLENFLLMGGVDYNSDSTVKTLWNYLPGSLTETNAINDYLQKKNFGVNYFKGNNASEAVLKEKISSSSIVHIATHGFFFADPEKVNEKMKAYSESNQDLQFRGNVLSLSKGATNYASWSFVNNKNPLMRSGIVLAGANDVWQRNALQKGEDGILTALEVSNLDLRNTKLVVLSACETGLGDIKGSEGVFGLQRAFKMAGVKYLIMSLWQVPDKETSEFMILFYKNLIKLKDIPTAFQKTQKVMRDKYDPYYWGAFVLIE